MKTKKLEVLETKLKLPNEKGGFKTSNAEVVSVFQAQSNIKRGTKGKVGTITLNIPDDWTEEMVAHVVGSREAENNFLLIRIPLDKKATITPIKANVKAKLVGKAVRKTATRKAAKKLGTKAKTTKKSAKKKVAKKKLAAKPLKNRTSKKTRK